MAGVDTICRWSYKKHNRTFGKKKKNKFRIPNIDVKVIPFINGRWDEGIFQKIMFHTRERKITEAANREVL